MQGFEAIKLTMSTQLKKVQIKRQLSLISLLKFTYIELRGKLAIKAEFKDNIHSPVYYFVGGNGTELILTHL